MTRQQLRHFTPWSDVELILATVAAGAVLNLLGYLIAGRGVLRHYLSGNLEDHRTAAGIWIVILVAVLPILLGIIAGRSLNRWGDRLEWIGLDSVTRSPDAWGKATTPEDARYLTVFLRDQTALPIHGRFGGSSIASNFFANGDIFLEELWETDGHGNFVRVVENSGGCWVAAETISRIEFIKSNSTTATNSG